MRQLGILFLLILVACRPSGESLLLASKQGDCDQIKRLLDRGVALTVVDRDGQTPLHLAAHWGRDEAAILFLDRGAPIEAIDRKGRTPLHVAARENQRKLVNLLLERGAARDTPDHDGSTPLHLAAEWNAGETARILIDHGAATTAQDNDGLTPLHTAAAWGTESIAAQLLDARAPVQAMGHQGQTPLHLTTKGSRRMFDTVQGQVATARLLLAHGAAVDAALHSGDTSLHLAAQQGDVDMARFLVEQGATVDAKTGQGLTPLHKAIVHNQIPVTRFLLDHGANIGAADRQGKTAIHLAAELGQAGMVRLLLERGAPVAVMDKEGRTPLHEPASRGHDTVVQLLLDRGASVDAFDIHRWTPLHLATFHGRATVVRLLLDKGAQVNASDADGVMPLHGASYFGYTDIERLLIGRGAAADLVDDRGYLPAQYARRPSKNSSGDSAATTTGELVPPAAAAPGEIVRLHLPLIKIDGSSTVYPMSEAVADRYAEVNGGRVRVSVGISGTGGGFQKFCRGETDVQDASRPINTSELELCQANRITFHELPIGYDALSVVVSANNTWVESLTIKELKTLWEPAAYQKIMSWNQIRNDWPVAPLNLFGAGSNSGTFDYFTEAVVGKVRASRADYTGSEDDNVLVDAIAGNHQALGYVPFAYVEPNRHRLKALAIDAGNGPVLPSKETVLSGQYQPLSRPMFIYVNQRSAIDGTLRQFVEYYLTHAPQLMDSVGSVPFRDEAYTSILAQFRKGRTGTMFDGKAPIGMTIEQFLAYQEST